MPNSPGVERRDLVDKVKNEKMRMHLGNHWNDEFHNPTLHNDHITCTKLIKIDRNFAEEGGTRFKMNF